MKKFIKEITLLPVYNGHGVDLLMLLQKGRNAVEFIVYTHWGARIDSPVAAEVRYHSNKIQYEGQLHTKNCTLTHGRCYSDATYTELPERCLKVLISQGSNAVWPLLEDFLNYNLCNK